MNEVKLKDVDCREDYERSMCLLMMCTDLDHPRSFGVVMYMIGYELSFSLSVDLQLPSMQKYTFPN